MAKPVILFAGAVYPGQFGALCEHLRKEGMAETYFMTTPGHRSRNRHIGPHLREFTPDGPIVGNKGYYYSAKPERSARIGRGLLTALQAFSKTRRIDAVVAHSLWGAPHFLYGEIDAAIISYIEFPSFRAHGWDPDYPPDAAQRMADRNTEMLNFHQAVNSDLVICPSQQAKRMFPAVLQGNIEVQLEGLEFGPALTPAPEGRPFTIGFAARDLSNAKGFDRFFRIVDQLADQGFDGRVLVLGGSDGATYGSWGKTARAAPSVSSGKHNRRASDPPDQMLILLISGLFSNPPPSVSQKRLLIRKVSSDPLSHIEKWQSMGPDPGRVRFWNCRSAAI